MKTLNNDNKMIKANPRNCRTEYCQYPQKSTKKNTDMISKGEQAKQLLHQLSIIDYDSDNYDHINSWVQYNQVSKIMVAEDKQKNKEIKLREQLMSIRNSTALIQKKSSRQGHKKYVRDSQFKKKLKSSIKLDLNNSNCASVSLKLNFTSKNSERIHSHSIKLDPQDGKLKIKPKSNFTDGSMQNKDPSHPMRITQVSKPQQDLNKRSSRLRKIMMSQKRRQNQPAESPVSDRVFPPNLANFQKFQIILKNLRNYERQNFIKVDKKVYQAPAKMKGTFRRTTRFSTS